MPLDYRASARLPGVAEFEETFRRAYGREMTSEERHFFNLARILLDDKTDSPEDRRNVTLPDSNFLHG